MAVAMVKLAGSVFPYLVDGNKGVLALPAGRQVIWLERGRLKN